MFNNNDTPYHADPVHLMNRVIVHFEDGHRSESLVHTLRLKAFVEKKMADHGPGGRCSSAKKIEVYRCLMGCDAGPLMRCYVGPGKRMEQVVNILGFVHEWGKHETMEIDSYITDTSVTGWNTKDRLICDIVRVRVQYLNGSKEDELLIVESDVWRLLHHLLEAKTPEEERIAVVSFSRIDESRDAQRRLQVETGEITFVHWQEEILWMHPTRQRERAVAQAQEDCSECCDGQHETCVTCGGITKMHPEYPAKNAPRLARCICTL